MNTLLDGFLYSDSVGRGITVALLACNAYLWACVIAKIFQILGARKAESPLMERMKKYGNATYKILGDLDHDRSLSGPVAALGRTVTNAILELLRLTPQQKYAFFSEGVLPRALTEREMERIQAAMEDEISKQKTNLEESLSGIATLITIGPMLGLFGTVWGVMATFVGIVNNGGRPDIQAIAPGIAGALLTTVVGLFVAIPGTVANNVIVSRVDEAVQKMENLRDNLLTSLLLARTAQPAAQPPQTRTVAAAAASAPSQQPAYPPQAQFPGQPTQPAAAPYGAPQPAMTPTPAPSNAPAPFAAPVASDTAVEISLSENPEGGSPENHAY